MQDNHVHHLGFVLFPVIVSAFSLFFKFLVAPTLGALLEFLGCIVAYILITLTVLNFGLKKLFIFFNLSKGNQI